MFHERKPLDLAKVFPGAGLTVKKTAILGRRRCESDLPSAVYPCGQFELRWLGEEAGGPQVVIVHRNDPEHVVWSSVPGRPFVRMALGRADVSESRGFFKIREKRSSFSRKQSVDHIERDGEAIILKGKLGNRFMGSWSMRFEAVDDVQLRFEVQGATDKATPGFRPRIRIAQQSEDGERFFGFGERFTFLEMGGRRVPVLSQEPGIGRGIQPLTWILDKAFGAGGSWQHSNAPVPWFMTNQQRGFCLENTEYSRFSFTRVERMKVTVFSDRVAGRIFYGRTPLQLLEAYTRYVGRMPALPSWMNEGAVIGMQGGEAAVRKMWTDLVANDVPVGAFWLQDWIGARKTAIGSQLWWNWEVDPETYPDWPGLVKDLAERGIRMMTYINPFLVDPSEKGTFKRNLYAEARDKGFLIKNEKGEPYPIMNTSFSAALLDLSNPEAQNWIKEVIKTQLIGSGASGWMADFGEALPFDANIHDEMGAPAYHNLYPVEWARLNREAIEEAGLAGDAVFFTRAGFTGSSGQSTLFWAGDQLTSWRKEDGIKSLVTALLSSGMSGISLNHGDIGGYIATTLPQIPFRLPFLGYQRGRELMLRWIELCAFTAVFRTHEGNQPNRHHQINDDPRTMAHFARFARIYRSLAPYRTGLMKEAAERGYPVVRHPWLNFPDDPEVLNLRFQFMLGSEVMVAPVLDPNRDEVRLYLPRGAWTHLWSGQTIDSTGEYCRVAAPIGAPAIFTLSSGTVGEQVKATLLQSGDFKVSLPDEVLRRSQIDT